MTFEFKFPDVGEGISEGEIVKWRVKEGDIVKQDQIIVDIETDKAVVEIPSPREGKILKLHSKEGTIVKVGAVLVTFEDSMIKNAFKAVANMVKKEERASVGVVGSLPEYEEQAQPTGREVEKAKKALTEHIKALPMVKKLAKEKHVDLANIVPTGKDGVITKEDVLKAISDVVSEQSATVESGVKIIARDYDVYGYIEKIPLKGIRKTIARRMLESSQKTAPVTTFDEADVTHLFEIREKENKKLMKKGVHLTFLPFIIKAVIAALRNHPYLNANVDDVKEEIIIKKYYNIGVAVDTADGLIVPVLKIADSKTVEQTAKELQELSEKVRNRTVDLGELQGGTFTITNIGSVGGLFGTPIINYPQVAILLTGRIYEKPVVIKGKVRIRKVLPLSLTFDHRITDGAEAQRFMNDVKEFLEDPDELLLSLK
jgi:pyruvate dehydrogenase E2 component (dihydrolipoamide acetyltransferase)